MPSLTPQKSQALRMCKQALGTLNTVVEMVERDAYCPEIIQQADSVIGLLRTVKKVLLKGHLDSCLVHKLKENKKQAIEELSKIYDLSL